MDAGGHVPDRGPSVRASVSRAAVVLGLVAVLLLVVLVVLTARTAGEMPITGGPSLGSTGEPPSQPPPPPAPTGPPPPLPSGDSEGSPVVRTVAEVMVALVVIGGIGLAAAAIALIVRALRQRQTPEGIGEDDGEVVVNLVAVQEHLERSSAELDVSGEVNQAIVRCWHGLEEFAAAGGTERGAAQTAREYTVSVLEGAALPLGPLQRLADLYEAALFSGDQLPESARAEAIACLAELQRTTGDAARRSTNQPTSPSATGGVPS